MLVISCENMNSLLPITGMFAAVVKHEYYGVHMHHLNNRQPDLAKRTENYWLNSSGW